MSLILQFTPDANSSVEYMTADIPMAVISQEDWITLKNKVSKWYQLSTLYVFESISCFTFYQFKLIAHHMTFGEPHHTGLNFLQFVIIKFISLRIKESSDMIKALCRLLQPGKSLAQHRSMYGNNMTNDNYQQGSPSS